MPPEIANLRRLRSLNLSHTHISALPPEIGQLKSLQSLDLSDTHISALPPEIGQLKSLQTLNLSRTETWVLPPEIGQLKSLQSLSIAGDPGETGLGGGGEVPEEYTIRRRSIPPIRQLPSEVGQLRCLKSLDLRFTMIRTLPPELGQLQSLKVLDLRDTQLSELPSELGSLGDELVLHLDRAPLQEPLRELRARGTRAILAYLRSLKDGELQYEAKVLLVGEGNVGKSSLVAALRGEPFIEDRPTTHGIEVGGLTVPHPDLDQTITLNTWDFGGQPVYHVTHQFFFSKRSLYLLAWRPREGQEENAIEGWLERIRLRIGDDARVMIVATHCNERYPELDYPELQVRFGKILVGNHQVDNKDGTGIAQLKTAIGSAACALPQMGERMSTKWIEARDEIRSLSEPQVERRFIDALCHQHGIDDQQTETLIDLLHDLGHIVYFREDEGLRDVVVLQPEWLTKAIGYVLEDRPTRDAQGELDHARLREIWWDHGKAGWERYPPRYHRYFLRLMEKFDICYRIPDRERSLVGQLVPHARPQLPWARNDPLNKGDRDLALIGELSHEAPGLMAWLTVRNHRFATGQHWRHGVFLAHKAYASEALTELVGRTRLYLIVRAPSPDYFFSILRDSIEELIELRWEGLRCDFWVPCATMLKDGGRCRGRFNFRKLLHRREHGRSSVECDECFEEFDVQQLLTGFPQALGSVDQQLELERLGQLVEHVDHRTERIEQMAAEAANGVRATLTLLSKEVNDCPRLFVLRPTNKRRWSPARVWQSDYTLTLCCEHPGHEHAWSKAAYKISQSREWLEQAGPYISVISKTLRVAVPIAGALAGTMMDEVTGKNLADEIKLMDKIAGALPSGIDIDRQAVTETDQLTRAEGDGLRALRQLLLELDKPRSFGGMRRAVTPSGDVLWICPQHYSEYDPGLPELPYDTTET